MKLRALGMKGYPPIMSEWGPLDLAGYDVAQLRTLYALLSQRLQELKAYIDSLEARQN